MLQNDTSGNNVLPHPHRDFVIPTHRLNTGGQPQDYGDVDDGVRFMQGVVAGVCLSAGLIIIGIAVVKWAIA